MFEFERHRPPRDSAYAPVIWKEHRLDEWVRPGVSVRTARLQVFGAKHADVENVRRDVIAELQLHLAQADVLWEMLAAENEQCG